MLEPAEDLARHDLLTRPGDQPMVQEDRRTGVPEAAEADLGLPEPGLELLPVLLVGRLDIDALLHEPLKHEVLDQIGRREVDDDELEQLTHCLLQFLRPHRHVLRTVALQPGPCLYSEIAMRLDETVPVVVELVVGHRRVRRHHLVERRPIPVRRPHLEPVLIVLAERRRVRHQLDRTHRVQLSVQRIEQELQRREALLTVNDRA